MTAAQITQIVVGVVFGVGKALLDAGTVSEADLEKGISDGLNELAALKASDLAATAQDAADWAKLRAGLAK